MIGQIIQSYLVSLGVQVDKPGFQQADQTIKQTGENVERITGGMARNFVKASTIIGSAIASVTASAVGLMKAAAQEDLAMQKYARSMMMSEDAAWRMKKATDALGESINDIALTPELLGRFTQLTADGSKMKVGGDFKQTMKDFRDLMFEFTRLKQEASYALNWVGYYLMKYLQKPLADIREKFKAFNDSVIKNMSVWTEKVARAIYYVIEVGRHLIEFLGDIGKAVYKLWDSFPSGVKKAIAAITALNLVLRAGPLGRSIMLISTLLLLIDDYYGYMEGKNAAFGKYWDKLNEYLEKGKVLWEQLKTKAEPYWNMLVEYAGKAKDWFDELVEGAGRLKKSFDEWMESTGNELLADVVEECQSLWGILTDIGSVLATTVKDAWKGFNEQLEKNDTIKDVTKGLESLWRIAKMLYKAGKDLIKFLTDLWREVEKSQELREFGAAIMELVDAVGELFTSIMELVETAIKGVFGEMGKTGKVYSFRDAIRAVLSVFTKLVDAVSWAVKGIAELFDLIAKNKTFKAFWETVGGAIDSVISKIGRFSRAMIAFLHKDVEKAKRILMGEDDQERHGTRELSETEKKWEPYIQEYAKKHNVDPNLLRAIIKTESGFNPDAISPAGAIGMAQFMPSTAAAVGIDPHDPIQSIEGAAMHLRTLIDSFGSERLAIAAYNAGAGAVKKYGDVPPFQETQEYVEKVLAAKHGYESDDSPDAVEPHYLGKAEMESSLENVRWFKELAPWIGGMLKKAGAGDAVYTSGARTLEHQMRINPEAPNSYHVDRGKGGDAVDIDLPDGVDTEAIVEMFKPYFKEVLYHSVDSAGGGLHLHLGGYLGNANLDFKKPADPVPDPSAVSGQEPAWDGPPARPAESSEEDYLPPTESHENDEKSWCDVLTEVRDSVIKGALGDETGQEVIDAANTAKETIGDFIGQIVKNGEDINSEHEEVMGKLEDYVKPTAYTTTKGQVTPLGMAQGTPNPADWVGGNAERMRSGVLVPLGTNQFPREPATQIQKKADTSIPVEMLVCLKQTVFLLTEIRKAMPSIGSLLPTLEKLMPKQEQDSPVVPSKPQERPQTDSLSQVTALLADIKRAIQSLGTITVVQPPTDKGERYEIVYPEAKEKPEGENLAGILQQILAAAQGIKKDLPDEVNLEKVMEPLQNAFPTEAVAELKQAAENLQKAPLTKDLEQVGDKIAGEVAKAMPVGDFEAIEGFLKNAGFEGFGKHIQDLGKIGRAATEPLLQAQAPVYVSPTIDGGKQPANVNVKVDLGGITVNGVKDPQAAADVVFKNAEKEFSLAYGRLLSNNHGLQA